MLCRNTQTTDMSKGFQLMRAKFYLPPWKWYPETLHFANLRLCSRSIYKLAARCVEALHLPTGYQMAFKLQKGWVGIILMKFWCEMINTLTLKVQCHCRTLKIFSKVLVHLIIMKYDFKLHLIELKHNFLSYSNFQPSVRHENTEAQSSKLCWK